MTRLAPVLAVLALLLALTAGAATHTLRVQTYWDPLDGDPVRAPARLNVRRAWMVTDTLFIASGAPSGPSRLYYRPDSTSVFPFCYTGQTGEFLVELDDSLDTKDIEIRAAMGFEALPCTTTITWEATGTTVACTLVQYADMADSNWRAFDPWVLLQEAGTDSAYSIDEGDLRAVMDAEGLDAVNLLDGTWDESSFTYDADEHTDLWNDHGLVVWCQRQITDGAWGYILPMLSSASPTVGGATKAHIGNTCPGFFADTWYDRIDALSGLSILAGGYRGTTCVDTLAMARDLWWSPLDSSITEPDAVMICEGLLGCPVGGGGANERTYKNWRRIVDVSHPIPVAAGSHAALSKYKGEPAIGSWRYYSRAFTGYPAEWIAWSMEKGSGYATSGPLITRCTLGGKHIGVPLTIDVGDTLALSIGLHSPTGLDSIRIWLNGEKFSAVTLNGVQDTTYTADIPIYGGTDCYVWLDVVGGVTYDVWYFADARAYAITSPWAINVRDRGALHVRADGLALDVKADSLNSYYTTKDDWPDKATTKASADSTNWLASYALVHTEADKKVCRWVRPTGRTAKTGNSEFPYTSIKTGAEALASGDTLYLYGGYYTRDAAKIQALNNNVVIRGFPEISRPAQVAINQHANVNPVIEESNVDGVKVKWLTVRNGTAILDVKAVFMIGAGCDDWVFDHVKIADMDCGDADNFLAWFVSNTDNLTIRDCVVDSIDGGEACVLYDSGSTGLVWTRNRVLNVTAHEDYPFYLYDSQGATISNSLWQNVDAKDNKAPGINISIPDATATIRGCTFVACSTHNAAYQDDGVIRYVEGGGDEADRDVVISHCVFAQCDSTYPIGLTTVTGLDTLAYSLRYDSGGTWPAADDTTGLLHTDPHFNMERIDREDVYRATDTRCMELATATTWMGWLPAMPPNPLPSMLMDQYGSSCGGTGGGEDSPHRLRPKVKLPPPGG